MSCAPTCRVHPRGRLLWAAAFLVLAAVVRGDGSVTNATDASLRNELKKGGIITLDVSGTLRLTNEIIITTNTTLRDPQGAVRLEGSGSNRLFVVQGKVRFRLERLFLTGGVAAGAAGTDGAAGGGGGEGGEGLGGAILVQSNAVLVATNCAFGTNAAVGGAGGNGGDARGSGIAGGRGGRGGRGRGGAIYNQSGSLFLTNCVFEANEATGGAGGAGGAGALIEDGGDGGNGGEGAGGALFSATNGVVFLVGCQFAGNVSTGAVAGVGGVNAGFLRFSGLPGDAGSARGGALAGEGTDLELSNCTFEGNRARAARGADGPDDVENRSDAGGGPGGVASGGAVHNQHGSLTMDRCTFMANAAYAGDAGDAGYTSGVRDGGNGGDGGTGDGGAVTHSGSRDLRITDSTFDFNTVFGGIAGFGAQAPSGLALSGTDGTAGKAYGGALYLSGGGHTVERTTFDSNVAQGAEGLEGLPGTANADGSTGNPGGGGGGGAIASSGDALNVVNSTFHGNAARGGQGGKGGDGSAEGLFGSDGGRGGTGGRADGGAILHDTATSAMIIHCTFATNAAAGGPGGAGGAAGNPELSRPGTQGSTGTAGGGALAGSRGLLQLRSTIFSASTPQNVSGALTNLGGNLSTDTSLGAASLVTDLRLGELLDNGGSTKTLAPGAESMAIGRGVSENVPLTDQRGEARVVPPDSGAVELELAPAKLAIQPLSGAVRISWPMDKSTYRLQATPGLPPSSWLDLPGGSALEGNTYLVTNATTDVQQYYRLQR